MTAMMITIAAPAISKVSVDMPVPGVGATVGDEKRLLLEWWLMTTVVVVTTVGVIAGLAEPTVR